MLNRVLFIVGAALLGRGVIPDPDTWASKWATRTGAASADYVSGAEATTKDPTAAAINAGQRYIDSVTAAFQSGKWANALRKAGKAGWLAGVTGKGAANFANGVRTAQANGTAAAKIAPVLAFEKNLQAQINAMPNVTDQDRVNRAVAWINGMRAYKTGA